MPFIVYHAIAKLYGSNISCINIKSPLVNVILRAGVFIPVVLSVALIGSLL